MNKIYTIGHSNQSIESFIENLSSNNIDVIVDVRSQPYSQYVPHFNQSEIQNALNSAGIKYLFMGKELGARRDEISVYNNDQVSFAKVNELEIFKDGVKRLEIGLKKDYTIALMCACGQAEKCHRTPMIVKVLVESGIEVKHIKTDGDVESHKNMMFRLSGTSPDEMGLFQPTDEELDTQFNRIYDKIESNIAYKRKTKESRYE